MLVNLAGKKCTTKLIISSLVLREEEEVGVEVAAEPAEADHVGLGGAAAGLATGGERVAHEAGGTGADGAVVARLALRILSARVLAGGPAVVVETGAVQRTLAVVYTLAYGISGLNCWVLH